MRYRKWNSAAARRICQFAGVAHVEGAVIEVARRLLHGVRKCPTDLDAIFSRVDIERCIIDPQMLISGELRRTDQGFVIACSPHEPVRRRRFTIAHEIGHAVLEKTAPYVPHHGRELESICDRIATEILVPRDELQVTIRQPITLREVARIAAIFEASLTTTALRCVELFDLIVGQYEAPDIDWLFTPMGVSQGAIRVQIASLLKEHAFTQRGEIECPIQIGRGNHQEMYLQWRSTGRHGRKLVLVTTHSDKPSLPDANWTPQDEESPVLNPRAQRRLAPSVRSAEHQAAKVNAEPTALALP